MEAEQESGVGDEAAAGVCEEEEDLSDVLATHSGTAQLQELQTAVQKRNEIISQLSVNLQVALESRDQVQLEAMQLTSQIHALQQQLQQVSESLRAQTQGGVEPPQHSLQDHSSQQYISVQQCPLAQKETEVTDLQQKLGIAETAVSQLPETLSLQGSSDAQEGTSDAQEGSSSDALLQRLQAELQAERQASLQERERASRLEQLVQALETERREMQDQLAAAQEELSMEARRCAEEGHELSQEVGRFDGLVQELQKQLREEEAATRHLRAKHEADISNYELRLRSLEEDKEAELAQLAQAHEAALTALREEEERRDHSGADDTCVGESLGSMKAQKEHVNQETASESREDLPGLDLSFPSDQDHLMEKYLASIAWGQGSLEHSLLEDSGNYRFELDGEIQLENSHSLCLGQGSAEAADHVMDTSSSEASEGAEAGAEIPQGLREGPQAVDLGKVLLIQQCSDLTAQLEDRDGQVEELQSQLRRAAEEGRVAVERWNTAAKELESVRRELEAERERRLHRQEGDELTGGFPATGHLINNLREEKELLLGQLREQEQLVRDLQEQKMAGDSVTSDVQTLFGRQLSALQTHRDALQAQLDSHKARNRSASELLEQRTLQLESARQELQSLQAQLQESEERTHKIGEEKTDLESRLVCLEEDLTSAEEAATRAAEEKAVQERRLGELETKAKDAENRVRSERAELLAQLESLQAACVQKESALEAELQRLQAVSVQKESALEAELQRLQAVSVQKESALKSELQSTREALGHLRTEHDETTARLRRAHEAASTLQRQHQEEVQALHLEMERKLLDLKAELEDEQKKQIALIKQMHERDRERELVELANKHKEGWEAACQEHQLQAQAQQALELEALRLSLNNLHAAQLELTQSNLQRDKEAALTELQASLRDKWAQESAMMHTRQQFELDKVREQSRRQMDELKRASELQISEQRVQTEAQEPRMTEALKQDLREADLQSSLTETLQALSVTRAQLQELQASHQQEVQRLEDELSQAWADRDAAARAVEELVSSHSAVLQDQHAHTRHLEELARRSTEREQQMQQQVEMLQAEHTALKQSSEQEVTHLWSELQCMRARRQELG
ncbi:hypothetical protein AAFF_G00333390, partial [Aldrovandia affinis]